MPRCYTKSGSIEKYESAQWSTPTWSGATGSVTGPDSNGNYTVNAPSGYVSGGSSVKCTTNYAGKTKDFFFKKKNISDYNPVISFEIDTSISAPKDSRYITLFASFNENLHKSIDIKYSGSVSFEGKYISNGSNYSGTQRVQGNSYTCSKGNSSFKKYVGNLPEKTNFNLYSADFSKISYSISWTVS